MICPRCRKELEEVYTGKGVSVDLCAHCQGIWLDRGELSHFVEKPSLMEFMKRSMLAHTERTGKGVKCPRCDNADTVAGKISDGAPEIDVCPHCMGVWLDKDELFELNKILGGTLDAYTDIAKDFERQKQKEAEQAKRKIEATTTIAKASALQTSLYHLPNLAFGSIIILSGLYAVVFVLLVICNTFFKVNINLLALIALCVLLIQYLVSPWIMDFVLRCFQSTDWVSKNELPRYISDSVDSIVARNKMPYPKFGIIRDGTPSAFTYGRTPYDARIIITRGLLEILDEDEANAVVAHEIGHARNWDIAIMTMAGSIPTLLYYLCRAIESKIRKIRGGDNEGSNPLTFVLFATYIIYIVSQYLILHLSRIREYYADRFSGENTGNPNALSTALVKIAYGLAGKENKDKQGNGKMQRHPAMESFKAFGIFDPAHSRALTATSLKGRTLDVTSAFHAMQWDLWNPWATYYELNSTHPLPAKRILALNRQARVYGQEELYRFNLEKPESYWDDFFVDLLFIWAPALGALTGFLYTFITYGMSFLELKGKQIIFHKYAPLGPMLLLGGIGYFINLFYSYLPKSFAPHSIAALLKKVKVSGVRPIPVEVEGVLIGKGIPGLLWSEDMVLQDESGYVFLDYQQPLKIFEILHGLFRTNKFIGKRVVVSGWFRRAPVPYIEVKRFTVDDRTYRCYVIYEKWIIAVALIAAGAVMIYLSSLGQVY